MTCSAQSYSPTLTPVNRTLHNSTNTKTKSLKCLQINLRHCRAAALSLSQLIFDLSINIALLQEPYAISDPLPRLKYVPPGYDELHSLLEDHAYGVAIIARKSLKATIVPQCSSNSAMGVKINSGQFEQFLFSIYCRPSLSNLDASLSAYFSQLTKQTIEKSVFFSRLHRKKSVME